MYVPKKDRQLGFQCANSHQAGIVGSQVDHNEQGIKPDTCQGYRKKVVWKTTEELEWIRDPRSSVTNAIDEIPRQALYMCSPLRLVQIWRGYLCYLSAHDLVCSPCVRGGSQITFTILEFSHSLAQTPMFDLMALKSFLSNLIQGPNPKLVG
jgi:hypothetical protein